MKWKIGFAVILILWMTSIICCFKFKLVILALLLVFAGVMVLLVGGLLISLSFAFSPMSQEAAINNVKEFLGFDFGDEYIFQLFESRNSHPDRPQHYIIEISSKGIENLKDFCNRQSLGETLIIEKDYTKKQIIKRSEDAQNVGEHAFDYHEKIEFYDKGIDIPSFFVNIKINFGDRLIDYSSSYC